MKFQKSIAVILCLFCCMLIGCQKENTDTQIIDLTTNGESAPLGLDETPYFSWKMQSVEKGQKQTAYQIRVAASEEELKNGQYVWDSGKVYSSSSVAVFYEGSTLQEEQNYVWKVKVWDKEEREIVSETASFEMGKLEDEWEDTYWITSPTDQQKRTADTDETLALSKISYDFKMERTQTGFVLGAKEGSYGELYQWNFDAEGEQVKFTILWKDGEDILEVKEELFLDENAEEFVRAAHQICIEIVQGEAFTYVDDVLISSSVFLQDNLAGGVGFWVARGEKNAWYDNLFVQDQNNEVLFQEDFERSEHIFLPYYIKQEDGWGRADSGYILTPG